MRLSFEVATDTDAAAIAALLNAAAAALTRRYGQGNWSSLSTEKGVLRDMGRPKFQRTLIARDGHEIVAVLHLQTRKPWAIDVKYFTTVKTALYLVGMAVLPEWQGKGVGRAMMKEAVNTAKDWPANAIRLDAWDAPAGAGAFYAKCGFREAGKVVYRNAPLVYYERML